MPPSLNPWPVNPQEPYTGLKCKKMEAVANMTEQHLSGKHSSKNAVKITKCEPQKNKQCLGSFNVKIFSLSSKYS